MRDYQAVLRLVVEAAADAVSDSEDALDAARSTLSLLEDQLQEAKTYNALVLSRTRYLMHLAGKQELFGERKDIRQVVVPEFEDAPVVIGGHAELDGEKKGSPRIDV